jgi:undecaprenyl-diphosphatase
VYLRAIRVVCIAYLSNIAMKYTVRRPRPVLEGLPALTSTVTSLSYPSAHSTTSFAAARALSRALPAAPVYACACAMALSRVYAGVHYPTDIAAGAALGTALGEALP